MSVCYRSWRLFTKSKRLSSVPAVNFSAKTEHLKHEFYDTGRMAAWQVHSYGGLEELQFSKSVRVPMITSPNEIMVRVMASSVNPIDVFMTNGYGNVLLNTIRQVENCNVAPDVEFPLTMGRDFAGEIVAKGNGVGRELNVGNLVYGVVPVHQQGCHAQNIVVNKEFVRLKPGNLTIEEASSVMYAAITAWSALRVTGDLWLLPADMKRVLVLGGSGGVGMFAIQMLKAWGTEVVTTCSSDAISLVEKFYPDQIIDYKQPDLIHQLKTNGKFDIILDAAGLPDNEVPQFMELLKEWSFAKFVTLRSPLLRNTDKMGLIPGMFQNAAELLLPNLVSSTFSRGSSFRWAFFLPIPPALDEINKLVEKQKIHPVIQERFNFSQLPTAYEKVKSGHLRGKVILTVE